MMRLIRLYSMLFSLALRRQLTFRADLGFEIIRTLITLAASLAALLAVFTRTDQLGGFIAAQAVMLLGTFHIVSGLRQSLIEPNLRFNGHQIADGSFDAILIQPAPSIFLSSLGGAAPVSLAQSVMGLVAVVLTGLAHPAGITPIGAISWLLLVAAATVVTWATRCIIAATVFWALGFSLDVAYDAFWQLGSYPTTMLSRPLQVLTYFVPVAFLATVPTAVLIGRANPLWALAGVGVALISMFAATTIWRLGVRNYSSATS
jgi:ABC-2 type transport system permease protein